MSLPDTPNTVGRRPIRPVPPIDASQIPVRQAETLADFIQCLDQLRTLAGPLSHREIQSRSGNVLTRTKIGQVLNGELPRRDFLLVYLEVCGVPECDRPQWLQAWARLAQARQSHGVLTRREAQDRATKIVENAEAQAQEIVAHARAQVDSILAHARLEAERVREADDRRVAGAEEERDAALARSRSMIFELEAVHETSQQRIRAADEERDAAYTRAHDLAVELHTLHETSLQRIRITEDQRDAALARVDALMLRLEEAQLKIDELREQVTQLREPRREPVSARPQQDDVRHRYAPAYLVNDKSDVFGTDELTAPPVIGE
jgi:hypothetical protein